MFGRRAASPPAIKTSAADDDLSGGGAAGNNSLRESVELSQEDLFFHQHSSSRPTTPHNPSRPTTPSSESARTISGCEIERPVKPGLVRSRSASFTDRVVDLRGEYEELVASDDDDEQAAGPSIAAGAHAGSEDIRLTVKDFELLRVVGQGAFGKVFQVRLKHTSEIYAMKVLKKSRILEKDHLDYMRVEREILTSVRHPYIVTLFNTFQTPSKLYMVMEFINGGHLFFQLYDQGIFSEDIARFFIAEMILAVEHLHSLGFVHRDLKPENVLLSSEGHLKVTDFGLAKCNMTEEPRTNSMCGTIEYMAPEVVNGKGHGTAVDWWSIGILLYEMLAGVPPFRSKNKQTLKKKITSEKIKLPTYLTSEANSLLKGLLQKDPKKRLGYGPGGPESIKRHPFLRPINWRKLANVEIPSPFKPMVSGVDCVNNFDKEFTEQPVLDTPCGTPEMKHSVDPFRNFSFIEDSLLESLSFTNGQVQMGG